MNYLQKNNQPDRKQCFREVCLHAICAAFYDHVSNGLDDFIQYRTHLLQQKLLKCNFCFNMYWRLHYNTNSCDRIAISVLLSRIEFDLIPPPPRPRGDFGGSVKRVFPWGKKKSHQLFDPSYNFLLTSSKILSKS